MLPSMHFKVRQHTDAYRDKYSKIRHHMSSSLLVVFRLGLTLVGLLSTMWTGPQTSTVATEGPKCYYSRWTGLLRHLVAAVAVLIMLAVGAQPTWQILHGDECVVLNVSTMEVWESRTYDGNVSITESSYPGRNSDFDSQEDCLRYYYYNYNRESKEGQWNSYRYTEQVKHMCVPCSTVYGGAVRADCASRSDNARKLAGDRDCFQGPNAVVYDDLSGLLPELDCGIYLGDITCRGNEVRLSWYSKDQNGVLLWRSNCEWQQSAASSNISGRGEFEQVLRPIR